MAPNDGRSFDEEETTKKIDTFAVIDLETANLPIHNYNRTSITELCIYAFDATNMKEKHTNVKTETDKEAAEIPESPRVIHKLNLLFQPAMMVHPDAERLTGLNNYILERESRLNENAAQMIINFVRHLPGRVCLVAHNGWYFDFPIVRQAFEKLNLEFPINMLCVDSLRAFLEIDDKRYLEDNLMKVPVNSMSEVKQEDVKDTQVEPSCKPVKEINWQQVNESTPKRPILTSTEAASKRRQMAKDCDEDSDDEPPVKREYTSRRRLFKDLNCARRKRIPPRGKYNLASLFQRTFNQPADSAHRAEADVSMLTKLIQHYGTDFLAFAEEQAIPFIEVKPLGTPIKKAILVRN